MLRIFGAGLILAGSAAAPLTLLRQDRTRLGELTCFCHTIRQMIGELKRYRTPLPELFRMAASGAGGSLSGIIGAVADEMERRCYPDARHCVDSVIQCNDIDPYLRGFMEDLGRCLGRMDLEEQIGELERICGECEGVCARLRQERKEKLHLVRTLSLCAGVALVILLF
ncbi:MAG: hypothetical protein E7436_08320 [Ruminococcaceae bacterium]|nr:hypothetical protein [Oscillospiraceae bacterium]